METPELIQLAERLAEDVRGAIEKHAVFERDRRSSTFKPRDYAYASGFWPCARHMTLAMTTPWEKFDPYSIVRMEIGEERERAIIMRLMAATPFSDLDMEVISGQKDIILDGRETPKLISGRCEGELRFHVEGDRVTIPYEIKDWHPNTIDGIDSFQDMLHSQLWWIRRGARQFATYVWGSEAPCGLFFMNRKGPPKVIPAIWEECVEPTAEFLELAEEAHEAVVLETVPPFPKDLSVCNGCRFIDRECFPPRIAKGASHELNEERIQSIARFGELNPSRLEANRLWNRMKKWYPDQERVFAGDWILENEKGTSGTELDIDAMSPEVIARLAELMLEREKLEAPFRKPKETHTLNLKRAPRALPPEDGAG
jgi:hypothetical protein